MNCLSIGMKFDRHSVSHDSAPQSTVYRGNKCWGGGMCRVWLKSLARVCPPYSCDWGSSSTSHGNLCGAGTLDEASKSLCHELWKCTRTKGCKTVRCHCRNAGLKCTALCKCFCQCVPAYWNNCGTFVLCSNVGSELSNKRFKSQLWTHFY